MSPGALRSSVTTELSPLSAVEEPEIDEHTDAGLIVAIGQPAPALHAETLA